MNAQSANTGKHLLIVLILLSVIGLLMTSEPLQAATSESPGEKTARARFPMINEAEGAGCHPGSGWVWTSGPDQPETAVRAEQLLQRAGIVTTVRAVSFGETDSCGNFELRATDFYVNLESKTEAAEARRESLASAIYAIVARLAKPEMGNLKVSFSPGEAPVPVQPSQTVVSPKTTRWQQLSPSTSPSARYTHGMAYDSDHHVAIMFGGDSTGYARLNDTWQFDGTNWEQILAAPSPPGRVNIDQGMVYDSSRHKTVLFGGLGSDRYLNDTWEFNGATWTQITTNSAPSQRDAFAAAFDSHRGVMVLFGGYSSTGSRVNDTWEYDGAWRQVFTAQTPPPRSNHSMAFDSRRKVSVLFGGSTGSIYFGDTWEYDGTTWRQINLPVSPPASGNHSIAYDAERGVIVLFGGSGSGGPLGDTWEYDGATWHQVTSGPAPLASGETSLAYDGQRGKVLLFGGGYWSARGLNVSRQTWEYASGATSPVPGGIQSKVYVVVYDPVLSNGQRLSAYLGWYSHASLTQATINTFALASSNKMHYAVVDTTVVDGWPALQDGFVYTEHEYLDALAGRIPWHPAMVNYNAIVNSSTLDICGRANRNEIDEVWVYNGPGFGFYESTLVGPGAYWYNSPPVPGPYSCNRLIPIMGPSPERGPDCAIENFGHRTESTMVQVYSSWQQNRTAHNWEKFALVKALSPDYSYSGCGNIHYPPNGVHDYDYGNSSTVQTDCADFANYPDLSDPTTVLQPVTCSSWNCDHLEYFASYWFAHLPSNPGCGPDQVANNWWTYFASPAFALNPPQACPRRSFIPIVMRPN